MTRNRMLLVGAAVIALVVAGAYGARRLGSGDTPMIAMPGDTTKAPEGQRILVEVLNASGVTGLAKRAAFLLRDRGFDVVGWTNDPKGRRSQTLITDFTGKPEAAERLARVLGGAQIERGRDSLQRGLDLVVRLGSAYKPVGETFHP